MAHLFSDGLVCRLESFEKKHGSYEELLYEHSKNVYGEGNKYKENIKYKRTDRLLMAHNRLCRDLAVAKLAEKYMTKLNIYNPPSWNATIKSPNKLSKYGYIAYLPQPWLYTNTSYSGPGYGDTPQEAMRAATYWANQITWVKVVPANKAPKWARELIDAQTLRVFE